MIEKQKDCTDYSICNSYAKRYLHKLVFKRKTAEKQNDINNIAALSSKATADTPESDEEMRGVWVSYMELSMEMKVQRHKKRLKINLPK